MKIVRDIEGKLEMHDPQWCVKGLDIPIILTIPLDELREIPRFSKVSENGVGFHS